MSWAPKSEVSKLTVAMPELYMHAGTCVCVYTKKKWRNGTAGQIANTPLDQSQSQDAFRSAAYRPEAEHSVQGPRHLCPRHATGGLAHAAKGDPPQKLLSSHGCLVCTYDFFMSTYAVWCVLHKMNCLLHVPSLACRR